MAKATVNPMAQAMQAMLETMTAKIMETVMANMLANMEQSLAKSLPQVKTPMSPLSSDVVLSPEIVNNDSWERLTAQTGNYGWTAETTMGKLKAWLGSTGNRKRSQSKDDWEESPVPMGVTFKRDTAKIVVRQGKQTVMVQGALTFGSNAPGSHVGCLFAIEG